MPRSASDQSSLSLSMFGLVVLLAAGAAALNTAVKFEQIAARVDHGEGPHWSVEEQALYWVDIFGGDVWRLHPESGNITTCHLGGKVSVIVPVLNQSHTFVVGRGDALELLTWDGKNGSTTAMRTLVSLTVPPGARLNDGKVDARGRLWVGTMGPESESGEVPPVASLYRVSCAGGEQPELSVELTNVSVSNGIAWSADGTIMYYIDSPTKRIDAFDFEVENGTISNRRSIFELEPHNITGVPDGMTIDADDNLWVAIYGGGEVIVVNPHLGQLLQRFPMKEATAVTSTAWGSWALDTLYVTTSAREPGPEGGALSRLAATGAHGRQPRSFSMEACCTVA